MPEVLQHLGAVRIEEPGARHLDPDEREGTRAAAGDGDLVPGIDQEELELHAPPAGHLEDVIAQAQLCRGANLRQIGLGGVLEVLEAVVPLGRQAAGEAQVQAVHPAS